MRRALAIAALGLAGVAACKDRRDAAREAPAAVPRDAATADADLDACRAAAARAPGLPPVQRAQALLDGCRPCGDWQPLLTWNTPPAAGGPTRAAIEAAMLACHAYCDPTAKQRFLNTLDAARGQSTRGPWRHLGEMCKAQVSAVPDSRFMGAPYFALDRIARAIGALPAPGDAALPAAIDVPLPALSISGVGLELPEAPAGAAPTAEAGPVALTVDAVQVLLGTLPVAHLSATGLAVTGDYPGAPVELGRLAAALAAVAVAGRPVALLAPRALAAARIAQVVAAAGGRELRLAVGAPGPGEWTLPATVPIALVAAAPRAAGDGAVTTVPIAPATTAQDLASALAALAARGVATAALAGPRSGRSP